MAFIKLDCHPIFVSQDNFKDVVPHSQTNGGNKTSQMNYVLLTILIKHQIMCF